MARDRRAGRGVADGNQLAHAASGITRPRIRQHTVRETEEQNLRRAPDGPELHAEQRTRPDAASPPHAERLWALYVRAAVDDSQSIARQQAILQMYASQLPGRVAMCFTDRGAPGVGLGDLMRQAEAGAFDGVLAWNLRRFGWQRADVESRLAPLRSLGVVVLLADSGQEVTPELLAMSVADVVRGPGRPRLSRTGATRIEAT